MPQLDPHNAETWPEILDTEQAATVLQVDTQTVRRLMAKGKLPGRKVGRGYRIGKKALLDFIGFQPAE